MCDTEKIGKAKRIYTIISACSAALMLVFIILTEVLLAFDSYIAVFIMLAFAVAFCYTCVFTAFAAYDRALALHFVPAVLELGSNNVTELSERMSWKPQATEKFIKKCKKWKYID